VQIPVQREEPDAEDLAQSASPGALGVCLTIGIAGQAAATGVSVIVIPATVSIPSGGAQQFQAQVFGSANKTVRWLVNGVRGVAPSIGVISDSGFCSAPPDSPQITVDVEAEPAAAPAAAGHSLATIGKSPYQPTDYFVSTTGNDGNPIVADLEAGDTDPAGIVDRHQTPLAAGHVKSPPVDDGSLVQVILKRKEARRYRTGPRDRYQLVVNAAPHQNARASRQGFVSEPMLVRSGRMASMSTAGPSSRWRAI
jgi:hypothetical protein